MKENYRKACPTSKFTAKLILLQYPAVVEPIFDTIDALAYEAAKILQRQIVLLSATTEGGENGLLENGGRTATLSPQTNDGLESQQNSVGHQNLQPVPSSLGGGRTSSLCGSSYAAGGKRGSNASAISGVSTGTRVEKNELTETFDRLNELCRMNNQLLITLGLSHGLNFCKF